MGGFSPIGADDTFALEKVRPGRYYVTVGGYPAYVKSVRAGDSETEGNILDVRNGSPGPVTLTLSSNFGDISGTVNDANGPANNATVVLFALGARRWQTRTTTDASGAYRFSRIQPGKYTIAAVLDESAAGEDPDDNADTIEVRAGEKASKDLKLRQ